MSELLTPAPARYPALPLNKVRPDALDAMEPELSLVRHGVKPAARYSMPQHLAAPLIAALQALGLACAFHLPEDQRAGIAYLSPTEQDRLLASPRGHLLYARDTATCTALLAAHGAPDNEAIGALLGYPRCCIEANLIYDGLRYNDYVRVARVSARFDWRLNIFIGGWTDRHGRQMQLASHFPCSLDCAASIAQADRRLALLDAHMPDLARMLRDAASMPVLLHDDSGLPADRRTGLCGAALQALMLDEEWLIAGYWPLRGHNPLPPALGAGARVRRDGAGLILDRPQHATDRSPSIRLGRRQWMLLQPA